MASSSVLSQTEVRIDVQPILPRNRDNLWNRAERERDSMYDLLTNIVSAEGIEPLLLKSPPLVFPIWVNVEIWMPTQSKICTDRAGFTISIQPRPYHQHEFEYNLAYQLNGKKKNITRISALDKSQLSEVVRFLLRKGRKPRLVRFREPGQQLLFWRPKNKIREIKADYLKQSGYLLVLVSLFIFFSPIFGDLTPLLALLLLATGLILLWRRARRPLWVRCEGKPDREPRFLTRVDSWQTVIFGIGDKESSFRARFMSQLKSPPTDRFRWHLEKVWYWGLDGKEEREQIVLTLGRGLVFCQIYQYGKDLYVGWDGHINYGQWVEQQVARGIDRTTRMPTSITIVNPGTQSISEYDLIDLNCLMEWTHAQIVMISKDFIKELSIDQEIDFKILRGERQGLTGEKKEPVKERLKAAFKRVG